MGDDTGEVVRESPMGLLTVAETQERAMARRCLAASRSTCWRRPPSPQSKQRIEEPRDVERLRLRLEGADFSSADLQGAGQRVDGDVIEIVDARTLEPSLARSI